MWSLDDTNSQTIPDMMGDNFYEGVMKIYDITHPDITTPLNGQDPTPTHLVPYTRKNNASVSPLRRRFQTSYSSSNFDYDDDQ